MTLPLGIKQLRAITPATLLVMMRMADARLEEVEKTVVVNLAEVVMARVPQEVVVAESDRSF